MVSITGLPVAEGIKSVEDLPHTLSFALQYRSGINGLRQSLTEDEQPPRNLWDKPHRLKEYLDELKEDRAAGKKRGPKGKTYIDFNEEDVE